MSDAEAIEKVSDAKEKFQLYLEAIFSPATKRNRSAVIHEQYAKRIVDHLKGLQDCDKQFRHFVRTNSFHLLDLPEAGLRDVLVVKVKDREKVQ